MLKIDEFKFSTYAKYLDLYVIDSQIRKDLENIESVNEFKKLLNTVKFKNDWQTLKSLPSYTMLNLEEIANLRLDNLVKFFKTNIGKTSYYKSLVSKLTKLDENKEKGKKILKTDATVHSILKHIFDYEGRRYQLLQFYQKMNFRNCLYCLAQSTIIYGKDKEGTLYLKGNLDHIKSQKKYPYLSVTINNLIPVCAHCNNRKSSNEFHYNPITSLRHDLHTPLFIFKNALTISSHFEYKLDLDKMNIDSKNLGSLNKKLNISALYSNYHGDLNNLIERFRKFNSDSYKKHLNSIKGINIENDLEYFISEVPYSAENLVQVPLHKFKSDFFKHLQTLKNKK